MVPAALLLIALLVVGGFAIVETRAEPPGAGYFFVTTREGYPISGFVQGMEIRVKVVPRGCYELDRIEVRTGQDLKTFTGVDEILIMLEDYSTEVTAIFRGYPEERCPYVTLVLGDRAVRIDRALAYLLLVPPLAAAAVMTLKGIRLRGRRFPRELTSLRFLEGKLSNRDLLDLVVFLSACRSVIEGDPALMMMRLPRRTGPIVRYEELMLSQFPISYEVVGLGRLAKAYPWVLDYALSRGLVPSSRKSAEQAIRKVLALIRAGRYEELPRVVAG